jgi:predicted aspartyl protease/thioredoxin-like negative regulator of GroEL
MKYRSPFIAEVPLCRVLRLLAFVSIVLSLCLPTLALPIQADDDPSKKLVKQADKLIRKGKLDEAVKLLQQAAESSGVDSLTKLRLAHLYVKQRRLNPAYEIAFPIAKAEPKNAYAFSVLGMTMLGAGRFQDSRVLFYTALNLNKRQALAWAGLGMLDFYENRIEESLANLEQAVFHDPRQADYLFAFAQVSARAEKYKAAADAYMRFLTISGDTDDERRARIKGLISFLNYLGNRPALYTTAGDDATTVPITLAGNRPLMKLRINNRTEPLNFVLDTGSGISVISEETAKRLGIDAITKGGYAKGIGGDGRFEIVYGFLKEVQIGEVEVRNVPVYIRRFHNDAHRVDGYIGLSLISKFLTTLDYGNLTFSLKKAANAVAESEQGSAVALPLRLTSSGFLSGEVQLGGVETPLNFIVDTGASVSVISDEVASLEAISPFITEEKMRVIGSAGVTEGVISFKLPSVSFGSHSRKDVTAIALDLDMINEASGFQQAGILGGNFLKNYKMTFDFKNSKVTFSPVGTDQ